MMSYICDGTMDQFGADLSSSACVSQNKSGFNSIIKRRLNIILEIRQISYIFALLFTFLHQKQPSLRRFWTTGNNLFLNLTPIKRRCQRSPLNYAPQLANEGLSKGIRGFNNGTYVHQLYRGTTAGDVFQILSVTGIYNTFILKCWRN